MLCQATLMMSSAWGCRHAWAEAATPRGESTTTTTGVAIGAPAAGVETTGNSQEHTALGLETPADFLSKTLLLGVPSVAAQDEDPLKRGSLGRPRRRLSSWPYFSALEIERRRKNGGRGGGVESKASKEGVPAVRKEGENKVLLVGGGGVGEAGGGTGESMEDSREEGRMLRHHRRTRKKRALRGGAALVWRDSALSPRETTQEEAEGLSPPAIEAVAVVTEGGDTTPHRQFGRATPTVITSQAELTNEDRGLDSAVFGAPTLVAGRAEGVDAAEKEDEEEEALRGTTVGGSSFVRRRRAAGEPSRTNAHEGQEEDDDDKTVDGFGSVGLLAFLVCFGLLFCVMEGGRLFA